MKTILTHNGSMHTDEVFATAILLLWAEKNNEELLIKRSREESEINFADIVYDIGEIYDPAKNRFDHHQKNGAGIRDNGIPFASAGLVWKHYGTKLCNDEIWQKIDTEIISIIDAADNGYQINDTNSKKTEITLYDLISTLKPTWQEIKDNKNEEELLNKAFEKAVDICKIFLSRKIIWEDANKKAIDICEQSYQNSKDKKIIILETSIDRSFLQNYFIKYPEPIYVISPTDFSDNANWRAVCVKETEESFNSRKPFPKNWRGLTKTELQKSSKIESSIFCHSAGFLFVCGNEKDAIKACQESMNILE